MQWPLDLTNRPMGSYAQEMQVPPPPFVSKSQGQGKWAALRISRGKFQRQTEKRNFHEIIPRTKPPPPPRVVRWSKAQKHWHLATGPTPGVPHRVTRRGGRVNTTRHLGPTPPLDHWSG